MLGQLVAGRVASRSPGVSGLSFRQRWFIPGSIPWGASLELPSLLSLSFADHLRLVARSDVQRRVDCISAAQVGGEVLEHASLLPHLDLKQRALVETNGAPRAMSAPGGDPTGPKFDVPRW